MVKVSPTSSRSRLVNSLALGRPRCAEMTAWVLPAAHRQAGALQVACGDLQHAIAGAVVDGQLHTDLFNGDVAHNAGAGHIQRGFRRW